MNIIRIPAPCQLIYQTQLPQTIPTIMPDKSCNVFNAQFEIRYTLYRSLHSIIAQLKKVN